MAKIKYPKCLECGERYLHSSVWGLKQGITAKGLCSACSYKIMVKPPIKLMDIINELPPRSTDPKENVKRILLFHKKIKEAVGGVYLKHVKMQKLRN